MRRKITAIFIFLLILTSMTACGKKEAVSEKEETSAGTETEVVSDKDAYYEEISTVVRKIVAEEAEDVQNEQEIVTDVTDRGFTEEAVTSHYDMNGEYYEDEEASSDSQEDHPLYSTYYTSADGDLWSIMVVNGVMEATPVSWLYEHDYETMIVVAETDTLMSYDSETNTFYETVPKDETMYLMYVDRIDAETLDRLDFDALDSFAAEKADSNS